MKKNVLAMVLALAMACTGLAACGGNAEETTAAQTTAAAGETTAAEETDAPAEKYKIGILQQLEHEALDAATEGFKQAVIDELGEENVEFDLQNGQNDSNTCATIANQFVSNEVDLIMANATTALQSAVAATDEIPILGTSITAYSVALGLDDFNGTVGGNISGCSDLAPLDVQADMVSAWFPEAKNVGLLYCSGEPNSQYQVDMVKAELEADGLTATLYPFADSNDLASVCTTAAANSDVIYVPTDNTVASNSGIVDGICQPAGVPIIAGEEGICKGCGVATLSISYYDMGYATGQMAVEILRDGADISTMPVGFAEATMKYNAAMCEVYGLTPLEGYVAIEQ